MTKPLYVFISHKKNINYCYDRIESMMNNNFIIVKGGSIKNHYDENLRILELNCNDKYVGLPEKIIKTFNFLISDKRFYYYTHFVKLDDDMKIIKEFDEINGDYLGNVHYNEGNRKWHMGRTGTFWDKLPYTGEFKPWCMGGFGYIVSRTALNKITPNHDYLNHIYEDVYVGLLMYSVGIKPKKINVKKYMISPDH